MDYPELEHTSNEPLQKSQTLYVAEALKKLRVEKQIIDEEIIRTQLILGNLKSRQEAKREKIRELKGMISPLKLFPNEIVSQVFEEYAAAGQSQPPWLVGHICSRWRQIALTTPNLWNNILIHFGFFDSNFEKEESLFCRSGNGSVSCTLISRGRWNSIDDFIPTFSHYACRISHLSLNTANVFLPLLELPSGQLTSLKTLSLNISLDGGTPIELSDTITLFEDCPNLRRVVITNGHHVGWPHPNILPLRLPWSQLTHLLLSSHLHFEYNVLRLILQRCTNLIQCRIPIPNEELDEGDRIPGILITLEYLEALEIVHADATLDDRPSQFFRYLFFPSLKRLSMMSSGVAELPLDDIAASIWRSKCNIEALHICSYVQPDKALPFLDTTPSLTDLSIDGVHVLLDILGKIVYEDSLHSLRTIECRPFGRFDMTLDVLTDTLNDQFTDPPSNNDISLDVHILVDGETLSTGVQNPFQRNWLRVGVRQVNDRIYEKEFEL